MIILDEYRMLINKKDPNSWADSIGRNYKAMIAYPKFQSELYEGIRYCILSDPMIRHPNHPEDDTLSRDHFLYGIMATIEAKQRWNLPILNKDMKWKISKKYSHTITSWLWSKGMVSNKRYLILWYIIEFIWQCIVQPWNWILNKLGGFSKEVNWFYYIMDSRYKNGTWKVTPWQKKLRKLMYPMYAQQELGFMLRYCPDSFGKRALKWIGLKMVSKHNIITGLLFGRDYIDPYQPTTGWRSGTILNETNDRMIYPIADKDYGHWGTEIELVTELQNWLWLKRKV